MWTTHSYSVTPKPTSMQLGKHYEVTLDRDATSFLGLTILHNPDGTVLITQPKLLTKLFALYPPLRDTQHKPIHPYPPLPKDSDPPPQPTDHYGYLRLLGILLYLTKSRPDIMAAVSFAEASSILRVPTYGPQDPGTTHPYCYLNPLYS
eukprot:gene40669-54993_t